MSDAAAPTTALALIEGKTLNAAEVFKPGGVRTILDGIRQQVATFSGDISTDKGRKEIASLAYKIARSKTALDGMGKQLTDQYRQQAEKVHEERRLITKELDELAQQVRKPLTDWENAEKARVAEHEAALRRLGEFGVVISELSSADVRLRLEQAKTFAGGRDWQEFRQRASDQVANLTDHLDRCYQLALQREEAERIAAEQAAREAEERRQREERERLEREARIAAEAAEKARKEAEERAAAERRELEEKARQEAQAIIVEQQRAAREAARIEAARAEAAQRAAVEAERVRVQAEEREKQRRELDEAVERERLAGKERARRQREQEAEDARKREANVAHHRKINREALEDIKAQVEIEEAPAKEIITAIANGRVRHVSIAY